MDDEEPLNGVTQHVMMHHEGLNPWKSNIGQEHTGGPWMSGMEILKGVHM